MPLFRGPSNKEVIHSPCTLDFGHSNNSKDRYAKAKEINKMSVSRQS